MGNTHQQPYIFSQPLPNSKQTGFSSIYRNPKTMEKLITSNDPNIVTLQTLFQYKFTKQFAQQNCLGKIVGQNQEEKAIEFWKYKQVFEKAHYLGSAIQTLKLWSLAEDTSLTNGKPMKLVGILCKNCIQWTVTDIACTIFGITSVPLYQTLGIQNLSYCLQQTNMTSCLVSKKSAEVLSDLKNTAKLRNLILAQQIEENLITKLKLKFKILYINDLLEIGAKNKLDYRKFVVSPKDCYTFSYTSGTTGPPKGAMLNHENMTAGLASLRNAGTHATSQDRYLSFLPLPHSMQRTIFLTLFDRGMSIVFFSGDITKIKNDAEIVKPTLFAGVPRLYNKMYDAFHSKLSQKSGFAKFIFHHGYQAKRQNFIKNRQVNSLLYDSLVFSQARAALGGKVKTLVSGSAPIKQQVKQFLQIVFSCQFFQGYGQTQNAAVAFMTRPFENQSGHVGGIVSGLEFKLCDIPEMRYCSNDRNEHNENTPRGEIWLRGPQVFMGYYKDEKKTKQAITQDGWLRTGDVGILLPHSNAMKIIDRIKNIFKLQQGQYVASEKIEAIYLDHPVISEIFFYGDSLHNFAVAIISPQKPRLIELAEANNIKNLDYQTVCQNQNVRIALCKELNQLGKKKGLMSFQQAKNLWIEPKTFLQKGVLTNTLKLQRFQAKKAFDKEIKQMYEEDVLLIK